MRWRESRESAERRSHVKPLTEKDKTRAFPMRPDGGISIQPGSCLIFRRFQSHCEFYPTKRHKTPIIVRMKGADSED
jgi:hypothetical protein